MYSSSVSAPRSPGSGRGSKIARDRRVRVVVVISQRVFVRGVAEITVFILGRRVLRIRPGIGGLLSLLLTAANGGAVSAVSGGKIVGFRNGTDNLRFLNGAANPVGLLTHLTNALFAVFAAFFQVFQLVGQVGAVEFSGSKPDSFSDASGLTSFHLSFSSNVVISSDGFFLCRDSSHAAGPSGAFGSGAPHWVHFGQIGCVPCAAFGVIFIDSKPENG